MPVQLGHGAFTRGELDNQTIDQAVAAFVHFRERFDHLGVTLYRAVTTSAVRNASNREVLVHRIYHEAGIELDVIEGEEEARLVRKATMHAFGATPGAGTPRAILDLGGGSLEVNLRQGSTWRGYSLPVGTVRLLETFGLDGAIGEAEAGMVRRYTATLMHTNPARRDRIAQRRRRGDRRQRRGARGRSSAARARARAPARRPATWRASSSARSRRSCRRSSTPRSTSAWRGSTSSATAPRCSASRPSCSRRSPASSASRSSWRPASACARAC